MLDLALKKTNYATLIYFTAGFLCAALASISSGITWQFLCATWVGLFSILMFRQILLYSKEPYDVAAVFAILIALHIGVIFGLATFGSLESLWTADSRSLHLPGVYKVREFLAGRAELQFKSLFGEQFQLTYFWLVPWFEVLGENALASALALLVLRISSWWLAFRMARELFDSKTALLTIFIAGAVPTQIYYSMVLYKDPMVQLLTMLGLYGIVRCYLLGRWDGFAMIAISLAGLTIERIYIGPMLTISAGLAIWFSKFPSFVWPRRIALIVSAALCLLLFRPIFHRDFDLATLDYGINKVRTAFQSYPDVDVALNMELSYPLAWLKILFTPFFTSRKFDLFTDLSALLTWGSFVSQFVIAASLVGFWSEARLRPLKTFILALPLVIFLSVFAYLAPFSGRQRDSFFPLIAMFAAVAITRYLDRKRTRNEATAQK